MCFNDDGGSEEGLKKKKKIGWWKILVFLPHSTRNSENVRKEKVPGMKC